MSDRAARLPNHLDLALELTDARNQQGLTQQQLADRLTVHRSWIDHVESGRRLPKYEQLQAYAEACGLPAHHFVQTFVAITAKTMVTVGLGFYEETTKSPFDGSAAAIYRRSQKSRESIVETIKPISVEEWEQGDKRLDARVVRRRAKG